MKRDCPFFRIGLAWVFSPTKKVPTEIGRGGGRSPPQSRVPGRRPLSIPPTPWGTVLPRICIFRAGKRMRKRREKRHFFLSRRQTDDEAFELGQKGGGKN